VALAAVIDDEGEPFRTATSARAQDALMPTADGLQPFTR
jgi:hypothetical protein